MTYQKKIGNIGEAIAADYLREKGYQLLDYNFITRYGELDLVALDTDCVVFVEVKTRTSATFGTPESSITPAKFDRLCSAGLLWMQAHPEVPDSWRIDAVAIILNRQETLLDIQHFININL